MLYRVSVTLWSLLVLSLTVEAQRINFSAFAGAGITLTSPEGPSGLNFNSKKNFIVSGSNEKVSIKRGNGQDDSYSVIYEIEAAEGFDLLVDITAPSVLRIAGDTEEANQIPLVLEIAYSNKGSNSVASARTHAIDAPLGVTSLIIPVIPRSTGTPGPPPDPFSGSTSSRPTGKVYVFIYGEAGPIGNVRAGNYEAEVTINVNYAGGDYE